MHQGHHRDYQGIPHCVEKSSIVYQPQEFIGCSHIVGYWFLAIVEESIRSPDLAGEQVIKWKNLHRPIKFQPLVPPTLPEENINRVFLGEKKNVLVKTFWQPFLNFALPPSFPVPLIECPLRKKACAGMWWHVKLFSNLGKWLKRGKKCRLFPQTSYLTEFPVRLALIGQDAFLSCTLQ